METDTLVLILAAGLMGDENYSWRIPVPRHLMPIRGEPLIRRTLRIVRKQGHDAVVVTDALHIKNIVKHTFAPAEDYLLWDTMLSTRKLWDGADRVVFLQGDYVFYDDAMGTIFAAGGSCKWDSSYGPAAVTVAREDYGHVEKNLRYLKKRHVLYQDCMQQLNVGPKANLGRGDMYDLDNSVIWEKCIRDDPWVLDEPKPVLLLLAAGNGARMGRLTADRPKAMLCIGNLTLAERIVDEFLRYGLDEVVVTVGHHRRKVEECLGTERKGVPVRYVHNPKYATRDIGSSIALASEFIQGRKCYIVCGDQLFSPALVHLLCRSQRLDAVLVDRHLEPGNDPSLVAIGGPVVERFVGSANPAEEGYMGAAPYAVKLSEFGTEILAQFPDDNGIDSLNDIAGRLPLYPLSTGGFPHDHHFACTVRGLNWAHVNTAEGLEYARDVVFPRISKQREAV